MSTLKKEGEKANSALFQTAAEKIWVPHLEQLMGQMLQIALGQDRNALEAQREILSRMFGRPTERVAQETKQAITITITPYAPQGEIIEGEVRVLPASPASSEPTPPSLPPSSDIIQQVRDAVTHLSSPDPLPPPRTPVKKGPRKNTTRRPLNLEGLL